MVTPATLSHSDPSTRWTPRRVDEAACDIARRVADGQISVHEGHHEFAALVHMSWKVEEVAYSMASGQQAVDLSDTLRADLVSKILDVQSGFFDISMMRTASMSGWIRQTAKQLARWNRNLKPRGPRASLSLVDPIAPRIVDAADLTVEERRYHGASLPAGEPLFDTVMSRDLVERQTELVAAAVKGTRPASRAFVVATTIRHTLNLPPLCRPTEPSDRDWVLDAVSSDQNLAARSLHTVIDIAVCGVDSRGTIDDRLLALWDEYSIDDLMRLSAHAPAVVKLFVMGMVAPMPKPSRAATRALHSAARSRVSGSMAHRLVARELVGAFLARSCRAVSEFDDTSDDISRATMVQAALTQGAKWPDLVRQAVAIPGSPFGLDEMEIEFELTRELVSILEQVAA